MDRSTRLEIMEYVAMVFTPSGAVTKHTIVDHAQSAGAPEAVIWTLEQLPERRYSDIRQLWEALPAVPIGTP